MPRGQVSRFPEYEDPKTREESRHWRRKVDGLEGSPGPGLYEDRSSLFEQSSSLKPTLPRVNFSRAHRDDQRR